MTGSSVDRASEAEGSFAATSSRAVNLSIDAQRQRLPIYKHREKLLWCVERYKVMIVVGQTGCGKSTRELADSACI
jgi:ATP-dependent RNA helicase DDX35